MNALNLKSIAASVALLAGLGAVPAHADVIKVFNASGLFSDGSLLGGTLTFDLTTGRIAASNLVTTGASSFTFVKIVNQSNTQVPGDYNVGVRDAAATEDFNFDLPDMAQTPLFDYAGGSICSSSARCVSNRGSGLYDLVASRSGPGLVVGSLTAAVPEPMSVMLMISGAAGMLISRRKRRAHG